MVATPIGNLGDITLRALEMLKSVDAIAAEDTRHTSGLLSHFGIAKKLIAVHQHNEQQSAEGLITRLQAGESVALVTDAGTPAVSDPGAIVVAAVGMDNNVVIALAACAAAAVPLAARVTVNRQLPHADGDAKRQMQGLARVEGRMPGPRHFSRAKEC